MGKNINGGWHKLSRTNDFKTEQKNKIRIAKELCYPDEVIAELVSATTSNELLKILTTARRDSINA